MFSAELREFSTRLIGCVTGSGSCLFPRLYPSWLTSIPVFR
jgi:hypothetical protein